MPNRRSPEFYYSVLIFLILLSNYSYFVLGFGTGDTVTSARVALTRSIVDDLSLNIDKYYEGLFDLAYYEGHYYTPHSPGPSLVAILGYGIWKIVASLPLTTYFDNSFDLVPQYIIIFCGASIPSALLYVVFFNFVRRFTKKLGQLFVLTLALAIGTMVLTYSITLFQHQLATFGIFGGFFLLWRVIYERAPLIWLWAVGVLFGLSVISEYTVVFAVFVIFFWAAVSLPRPRALYRTVFGGLPFAILLGLYNYAIFHDPFTFAYKYHVFWGDAVHSHGLGGIVSPSLNVLLEITFGTFRGLFFLSPFLLLSVPGLYIMWKRRVFCPRDVILLVSVISIIFLINCSYLVWWGGWSVGPRFLSPALPFMAIPLIFVMEAWLRTWFGRIVIILLITFSLFNVWIQSLATFPPDVSLSFQGDTYDAYWVLEQVKEGHIVRNPLFDHSIPLLLEGKFNNNLGTYFGLPGIASLIPLLMVEGVLLLFAIRVRSLVRRQAKLEAVTINSYPTHMEQDSSLK